MNHLDLELAKRDHVWILFDVEVLEALGQADCLQQVLRLNLALRIIRNTNHSIKQEDQAENVRILVLQLVGHLKSTEEL